MPLGFERLNERSQRPNSLINFIKPLEGPDKAVAGDFLERIAAQCYPVMKAAHISVMSLEEFPPNKEFLGRNFNAGECIQLVLKDRSGRWLGFKYVQMVMMHELAHCKQMNHSRCFWQTRNQYAQEMYDLWGRKYFGEGVWGRGQHLMSGSFVADRDLAAGDVPEHLCGGTYRRRGRKRKRGVADLDDGQRPSYAERQQRRIAKKFGKHGEGSALGEDDLVRGALEQGHRHQGKPRVASSKRGRELRAQAALARFEAAKVQQSKKPLHDVEADSDDGTSDIDWSDTDVEDDANKADENGFVKVCGEEDEKDEAANNEMDELRSMLRSKPKTTLTTTTQNELTRGPVVASQDSAVSADRTACRRATQSHPIKQETADTLADDRYPEANRSRGLSSIPAARSVDPNIDQSTKPQHVTSIAPCPICSLENAHGSLLCLACAHVLRPKLVKNTWRCESETCRSTLYLNAGDVGRCGICATAKPAVFRTTAPTTGLISADVLRWD